MSDETTMPARHHSDYLGVIGGKEVFIETADGERIIVGIVSGTNLERLV